MKMSLADLSLKFDVSERSSLGVYAPLDSIKESHKEAIEAEIPKGYDVDYTYLPYPSNFETEKELEYMGSVATERNSNLDFIKMADKSIIETFVYECKNAGLDLSEEDISELSKIRKESSIVILKIKYSYNRPRPYQCAERMGIEFSPMDSVSASTPSYPSGHTIQSLLMAKKLYDHYPDRMLFFLDIANRISWSRVQAGYHFPSDIEYGRIIVKNIISGLKTTMNLKSFVDRIDYIERKKEDLSTYKNRKKAFESLTDRMKKALTEKAKEHREDVGSDKRKQTDKFILAVSFNRGIGAYHSNPQSVRPNVKSAEQWALGRVNGLLYALKNLKYKRTKYDTDLLPPSHPLSSRGKKEKAVGDTDPTNFPKAGDDKKVGLRNSNYPLFPISYAENIREKYPDIWRKGGNIKGNDQYSILKKIQRENNGSPKTSSQEQAIRVREAWAARHFKDHSIAGVIAQVKWLVIGSRGISHMKKTISEAIEKRDSDIEFICKSVSSEKNGCTSYKLKASERAWLPINGLHIEKRDSSDKDGSEYFIKGTASSTSIDGHGTEMSLSALKSMALQFNKGVPVLPRHSSNTSAGVGEWDEVIGRTSEATIARTEVKKAADDTETQYSLTVRSEIYRDNEKSRELIKRLKRGEPIGQSIGGWFEDVRVEETSGGDIQRIIVEDVTLDHVAITRAPSNPDSNGLTMLSIRSSINNFKHSIGDNMEKEEFVVEETRMADENLAMVDEEKTQEKERTSEEEERTSEKDRMLDEDFMKMITDKLTAIDGRISEITDRMNKIEKLDLLDEDENEKEDHEEGAIKDDEDQIDSLKEDKEEDEKDLEEDKSERVIEDRSVVPFQDLPMAPIELEWSFSAEEGNEVLGDDEDWAKYKRAHLYFDPDKERTKSGYKLPIAKIYNGKLSVFFGGIKAAMGAVNGARGGVEIPDEDKKGVYTIIQKYYDKFGETAPPMRSDIEETQDMDERINKSVQSLKYAVRKNSESIADSNLPEEEMTEKELQMIAEIVTRSVQAAIGQKSTDNKPDSDKSENNEMKELQARLQKTEKMLQRYIEEPTRVGQHSVGHIRAGIGAKNEFTEMTTRAKQDNASNLARIVESGVDVISEENGPATASVTEIRNLLQKGLRAAFADGLINA